jgi:hypothetical protein
MKILIALALSFMTSASYSCTNFTGDFETEENSLYSVVQTGCTHMDVYDDLGSNQMVFDNVERLLYSYDLEDEGEVFAHVDIFLTNRMDGNKWTYNERDVVTYASGAIESDEKFAEVTLNADNNIKTILYNSDGTIETFIDQRK